MKEEICKEKIKINQFQLLKTHKLYRMCPKILKVIKWETSVSVVLKLRHFVWSAVEKNCKVYLFILKQN